MAHEQEFVAIRMRQTIDQYPLVFELLMDHVYLLPKFYADRLLDTHACDRAPDGFTPPTPPPERGPPPAGPKDAEKPMPHTDVTMRRAEKTADAQIDPGAAARAAALVPEPVYYLADQAAGNPGGHGCV